MATEAPLIPPRPTTFKLEESLTLPARYEGHALFDWMTQVGRETPVIRQSYITITVPVIAANTCVTGSFQYTVAAGWDVPTDRSFIVALNRRPVGGAQPVSFVGWGQFLTAGGTPYVDLDILEHTGGGYAGGNLDALVYFIHGSPVIG